MFQYLLFTTSERNNVIKASQSRHQVGLFLSSSNLGLGSTANLLGSVLPFLVCLRLVFALASMTPCLIRRYLGSNFLAKSMVSYIRPNPVDLPPPKLVLNPNVKTLSAVQLYILANFSRTSVFATEALPGCRTSTTIWRLQSKRLVMYLRVRMVTLPSIIVRLLLL